LPETPFHEPRLRLSKIYTRTGDDGETSLVGGQRVAKNAARIECFGAVDELNACLGLARVSALEHAAGCPSLSPLAATLLRVQHELFNLGSILATLPADVQPRQPRVTATEVEHLEREIDAANAKLPALKSFVLPGGSRLGAELHLARTVCRRAERGAVALVAAGETDPCAVRYLNRLSDALFVWSRWANHVLGEAEVLWQPNAAASGLAE
jgi:cob(I)alamin adenosyltransferase